MDWRKWHAGSREVGMVVVVVVAAAAAAVREELSDVGCGSHELHFELDDSDASER